MHEIVLPGNTFGEFLLLCLILCALGLSQLIMLFFSWKKRRVLLERINKELPEVIKKPLIMELRVKPKYLLHLFLLVLFVIAMFRFWDQNFSSVQYNHEEIRLKYHNRLKPFVLNWSDISRIEIEKKYKNPKTAIVIQGADSKIYKSNSANSKAEVLEIEEAYLKLKAIYGNRN